MLINLTVARDVDGCFVFREEADLTEIDTGKLESHVFVLAEPTTLSTIRANDNLGKLGIARNPEGTFNPDQYNIAYPTAFVAAHCVDYWQAPYDPDQKVRSEPVPPSLDQLAAMSTSIVNSVYLRFMARRLPERLKKMKPETKPQASTGSE